MKAGCDVSSPFLFPSNKTPPVKNTKRDNDLHLLFSPSANLRKCNTVNMNSLFDEKHCPSRESENFTLSVCLTHLYRISTPPVAAILVPSVSKSTANCAIYNSGPTILSLPRGITLNVMREK